MEWRLSFVLVVCLVASGAATASPIITIDVPLSYEPGVAFDITVALTGAEDLSLYTTELILSSPTGLEGVDYFFSSASEPAERYIFGGQVNEGFVYSILNDSKHRITLSDFLISGSVTTIDGVNDLLADVTVMTTISMLDDLTITIVFNSLELDSPASGAIDGFAGLQDELPTSIVPVPEPTSVLLFAWAAVLLKRRLRPIY